MDLCVGILIGLVISSMFFWNPWTTKGTLRIDHSNPEKDTYRFEINDLDRLSKKKKIIVRIDHHANLSQK